MTYKFYLKASIILTAFLSYLFVALSFPLTGHNDTQVHIDYAWQLSNGTTPKFYEGVKLPYDMKLNEIQFASHHPPLYYKIISPITGYLIGNEYSYSSVVLSVRIFNTIIALVTLTFIAIFGELFNIFNKKHFDTLFLIIFAYFIPFVKVSSLVFNEVLVVLLITVTLICTINIIRTGYTHKQFAIYLACTTLGMYSKASFLPIIFISLSLILLSLNFNKHSNTSNSITPNASILVFIVCFFVALVSGDFYYGNFLQSGYFWRAAPQSWVLEYPTGRSNKSLETVLSNTRMWGFIITGPLIQSLKYSINQFHLINIIQITITIAYLNFIVSFAFKTYNKILNKNTLLIIAAIFLMIIAVYLEMIVHAKGYGNYNSRYLLPGIIAICTILATGLLTFKRFEKTILYLYFVFGNLAVLGFVTHRNAAILQDTQWFQFFNYSSIISYNQQLPTSLISSIIIIWALSNVASLLLIYLSHNESNQNSEQLRLR